MDELFLYDRDQGLFKQILKHSTVIEGRYHVSPSYGHDLNTDNLNSFLKDEKFGLTTPDQKYPICVCLPPRSSLKHTPESIGFQEEIVFDLFFLCRANFTGQNRVKMPDRATGTSGHHPWYDWKDMKEVAMEFMSALYRITRKKLRSAMMIEIHDMPLRRYTNVGVDAVNGVGLSFRVNFIQSTCELNDYPEDVIDQITLPDSNLHPHHKH